MSVNEKLRDHLHDQLFDAILELQDRDECYEFFEDICTIQEMHAIAIRLEVARMLKAEISMKISSKKPVPAQRRSVVSNGALCTAAVDTVKSWTAWPARILIY